MNRAAFENIRDNWDAILEYVRTEFEIADVSFNLWIRPLKPHHLSFSDDGYPILWIQIPSDVNMPPNIFQNHIVKRYNPFISIAIEGKTGIKCTLEYVLPNNKEETDRPDKLISETPKKVDGSTLTLANLNKRYTFDTFVVGKNNNLAHAASVAVAENPGETYNPLFIYGGVGLGKTHLMQSIAHFILQKNPNARILYVTSETFTNELINAIRNKTSNSMTEFRNKYRNVDVLLIDDIQFIIGKESTQEEFFHTFNDLYGEKKQIIITSDKPPKDFETLEPRLLSRFEWGLTVDIQAPDYETRVAILQKKEELDNFNIDTEVIKYIAANVKSNIRELEGSLTKIVFMSKLNNRPIDIEMAHDVLRDLIDPDNRPEITPELIIQIVADHYNVSVDDLLGQKRNKEIVNPRQIAMYLCREMTSAPLQQIGAALGGKDHTTIIHGIEKISTEIKLKNELASSIDVLKKKISSQ